MPLTSVIQPYDPQWLQRYADEVARLSPVFGVGLADIHHVGSTAVPELAAKPEIDILAVTSLAGMPEGWPKALETLGYRRGGDLSAGHHFFRRNVDGVRTHKLHVCREGHPSISEMLRFRDHLRRNPADLLRYQELKLALERENTQGIGEYLEGKAPFIRQLLSNPD